MEDVSQVSFVSTVEVDNVNGEPEEIEVTVEVKKLTSDGKDVQIVTLKEKATGKEIGLEDLSKPEQQELVSRIGKEFNVRDTDRTLQQKSDMARREWLEAGRREVDFGDGAQSC